VLVRNTIYEEIRRDRNKGGNGGEVKREIKKNLKDLEMRYWNKMELTCNNNIVICGK
jgi:hypothetical protein